MNSPTVQTETPPRRWFQFSLRTLLIVTTLVACACGWLMMKVEQGRQRLAAVEAIRQSGGGVGYEDELQRPPAPVPGPAWLRRILGDDFFRKPVCCSLMVDRRAGASSLPMTFEQDIETRTAFQTDRYERLEEPKIILTLQSLASLPQLRTVYMDDSWATDASLQSLAGLEQLVDLSLRYALIGDAGLQHLRGLSKLKYLSLAHTRVTDAGLIHLQKLTGLTLLDLGGTQITDDGLARLQAMTQLQTLRLNDTKITDDALQTIQNMPWLQVLDLSRTQITDAGLPRLQSMTNLQNLIMRRTQMTPNHLAKLRLALPQCKIEY